jgi:signal transduction histidine kinase
VYPGIDLNFTENISQETILGPSEALNLFRICQEAIANSLKYAGATKMRVDINEHHEKYRITIADNGKGFDLAAVNSSTQNGLENMTYRAADIGCELHIDSASGTGTTVTLSKK